jgi:hypothetical protein
LECGGPAPLWPAPAWRRDLAQAQCQFQRIIDRYDWNVETTKAWINYLAPIARPVFKWNHDVVMGWGAEGLAKKLQKSDALG